jgi:hypothetical protein
VSPSADQTPIITDGAALVVFAYDVGQAIDLAAAQRLVSEPSEREGLPSLAGSSRSPVHFDFNPRPLRVLRTTDAMKIAGFTTRTQIELTVFDFGGVSVAYSVPLDDQPHGVSLTRLRDLAAALYENRELQQHSRRMVRELLDVAAPAVAMGSVAEVFEDYVIYHVRSWRTPGAPAPTDDHAAATPVEPAPWQRADLRPLIAQILRAELHALSSQEIDDALGNIVSYSPNDACLIDWNAALVFADRAEDTLAVLEFANVELLELRFVDDRLDSMLDNYYQSLARQRYGVSSDSFRERFRLFPTRQERDDLRKIAALQVDSAVLFESINNALKLLGDQYLARLYRQAGQRLHLPEWDASVLRKLNTLDAIYAKVIDAQSTRRMEMLEWIIILLFAVSIVQSFILAAK